MNEPIAIVGMACRFPDARSPEELWQNVLSKRRAFRRIPPERLNLEDYGSADGIADTTYLQQAAVLEGTNLIASASGFRVKPFAAATWPTG